MNVLTLLQMAASGFPDRVALGPRDDGDTYPALLRIAAAGGATIRERGADVLVYIGENRPAFAYALFAAAAAHVPFLPLNYRLSTDRLREAVASQPSALVVTDAQEEALVPYARGVMGISAWADACRAGGDPGHLAEPDPDDVAVLLQTSGTTSAPKNAILRHRHLAAYTIGTVEFGDAGPDDATLVSVPPYHVAAVASLLSNVYAGRRLVYLDTFEPASWLDLVTREGVTHTMVVPTMLARIVDHLDDAGASGPATLETLAYGGARMPRPVLERALRRFPETGFVNAYGLTETSSSIAVLGSDDHRRAMASDDRASRGRLDSVGRPLPGVEVDIRDRDGKTCPPGSQGEIWVRGPQISGEYLDASSAVDGDGWLHTRDAGWMDSDGFLYVNGRLDDTIIRGGENVAPAEIEDVLMRHPAVHEAAVVGVDDQEWGQRIEAWVVLRGGVDVEVEDVRDFARSRLRSAKTPDRIHVVDDLPRTATGKLLRRDLVGSHEGEPD